MRTLLRFALWTMLMLCVAAPAPLASTACATTATLSPEGAGIAAAYRLCAPATSFTFEGYNMPQRQEWRVDAGWTFDGVRLARADGAAFDRFTLHAPFDARFHDRRYVAIDALGGGWTVFLDAFRPDAEALRVRFSGFASSAVVHAAGATRSARATRLEISDDDGSMIYVGPRANIAPGAITVIAGPETPAWLRDRITTDVQSAVARMSAHFGRPPLTQPALLITSRAEENNGFKGGVIGADVIEMRLRGAPPQQDNTAFADMLTNMAAHEAAHLWLGGVWKPRFNDEQPWVHEGGAEYLARRLWQEPEAFRIEAGRKLSACLLRMDRGALDDNENPQHGQTPYDCGFVALLAAESASLRAGHGDIFDLWRAVLESADAEGFTPEAFRAQASARGGEGAGLAMTSILAALDSEDAQALQARFAALGVTLTPRAADANEGFQVRAALLMPFMAPRCRGGYGFSMLETSVRLDTDERCGAELAGDPEIVGVNGVNMMQSPAEAHAALRAACAARGPVAFMRPDGSTLAPITCDTPIPALPTVYDITALPTLPTL